MNKAQITALVIILLYMFATVVIGLVASRKKQLKNKVTTIS